MLNLNIKQISIINENLNKEESIKLVGKKLVDNGLATEGYIQGMLNRESQITTYLENGIAIPHGTTETKDFVIKTGIEIIFFKKPVDWGEGNYVQLLVGIAAKGMEHIEVLRALTHTLMDENLLEKFKIVSNENDVLDILTKGDIQTKVKGEVDLNEFSFTITLNNQHGLHARPCAELVKMVKSFENDIQVRNKSIGTDMVNAKSMLKVLNLGVKKGQELEFIIRGKDPKKIANELKKAINSGLGE